MTPGKPYADLLELVRGRNYFVLTTNVDHQFQLAGFDKARLFYTQGDYGLWQCSEPCHQATYDNEAVVRRMIAEQEDMRVPSELIPRCPKCGKPMTMNLRMTAQNPRATYACINQGEAITMRGLEVQSILLDADIGAVLNGLI